MRLLSLCALQLLVAVVFAGSASAHSLSKTRAQAFAQKSLLNEQLADRWGYGEADTVSVYRPGLCRRYRGDVHRHRVACRFFVNGQDSAKNGVWSLGGDILVTERYVRKARRYRLEYDFQRVRCYASGRFAGRGTAECSGV